MVQKIVLALSFVLVSGLLWADAYHPIHIPSDTTKTSAKVSPRQKKADQLYEQLGYKAAIELYKKMHANKELDQRTMARLANSFRLNNETAEAEYWYAQFVNESTAPEDILSYARVLQINGNCQEAIRWYKVFNTKVEDSEKINLDFIDDCMEVMVFRNNPKVSLINLESLNSESLDFVATPFRNGVVFTSTRGTDRITKNQDKWTNDNFSDLFFAERKAAGVYEAPVSLRNTVNGKYHDGVASFNSTQRTMYFTRNDQSGKSNKGLVKLKVYQSHIKDDGTWASSDDLPFNSSNFASCHPTVSADGDRLYFASNRPGGFGGMDIYVSKNINGNWSAPVNMGPAVNSAGNEIFPFIAADNTLYFASNGHKGLGGLDVFAVQNAMDTDNHSTLINIGKPFNTEKDDFGFYINENSTQGYLSSNRIGGMGEDDLYEWVADTPIAWFDNAPARPASRMIRVVDATTGAILPNVAVTVKDAKNPDQVQTLISNADGEIFPDLTPNTTILLDTRPQGYEPLSSRVTPADWTSKPNPVLRLSPKMCTALRGVVINESCDKPLSGASVRLFNKCSGEEEVFTTGTDGTFDFCLDCACEYVLIGSKANFVEKTEALKTIKGDCTKAQPFDVKMLLELEMDAVPTPKPVEKPAPIVTEAPKQGPTITHSKYGELYAGKSIVLKDIYYDYNKFNIREDASTDLNELLQLMQQYPQLEIELSSHTDARGSEAYNMTLSTNRAQAAMQYLVKRGISPLRIKAVGHGETKIINHCTNGVNCSDEEHQANRRTEVRVTRVGDENLRIEHRR